MNSVYPGVLGYGIQADFQKLMDVDISAAGAILKRLNASYNSHLQHLMADVKGKRSAFLAGLPIDRAREQKRANTPRHSVFQLMICHSVFYDNFTLRELRSSCKKAASTTSGAWEYRYLHK